MLFTHKLHMGGGAGQTSAGHRAPNTDVRADSQADDRIIPTLYCLYRDDRRVAGGCWVGGGASMNRRGARNDLYTLSSRELPRGLRISE